MGDIYTATVQARTKTWSISIDKSGYSSGSSTISMEMDLRLSFANPGVLTRGEPVLPSYVLLRIHDPDETVWTEITNTANNETTYTIEITDSADFLWQGRINYDTIQRVYSTTIASPVIEFYAYDLLMQQLEGTPAYSNGTNAIDTLEIIQNTLNKDWQWDLETVFGYKCENGSYTTTRYIDELHFDSFVFRGERGERVDAVTQVNTVCDILNLRVWQRIYAVGGTAGLPILYASHPWAVGQSVNVADATVKWVHPATGTEQAVGIAATALTDADFSDDTQFVLAKKVDEVVTRVLIEYDQVENTITPILDLARGGDFSDWTGGASDYFDDDSTDIVQVSPGRGGGGSAAELEDRSPSTNNRQIKQGSIYVEKDTRFDLDVSFYHAVDAMTPGQVDFYVQLRINGTEEWSDTPSSSSTSYVQYTSGTQEITASAAGQIEIVIGAKDDGSSFPIVYTANATKLYIDDLVVEIDFVDSTDQWTHCTQQAVTGGGERIERRAYFDNLVRGFPGGTDFPVLQTVSTNEAVSYFEEQGPVGPSFFDSLVELGSSNLLEDADENTLMLYGTINGLFPPERAFTYGGNTYRCAAGVELDLIEETTRGVWVKKLKTWGT